MLITESYVAQQLSWPKAGRHILAQYDEKSVVVYQAYRPSIGQWAIRHQRLGGPDFSYVRMSWIKPNFLWMMYRSGWGTKEGQETTLGLRLRREFFDRIWRRRWPRASTNRTIPAVKCGGRRWRHRRCGCSGIRITIPMAT